LGRNHADTATTLNNLGLLYERQGRYADAEGMYNEALSIYQRVFGRDHADTATTLHNLGVFCANRGRLKEAKAYLTEARAIQEAKLGRDHPDTKRTIESLKIVNALPRTSLLLVAALLWYFLR
jgi:tetratricopeptide (TPR) repeat protein